MTATRRPLASSVLELVVIVAAALVLALLIQAFIVKPYRIPSGSMLPTLHVNQRVLVNRIGMHFDSPSVGQIIVFHPPKNFDQGCADPTQGPDEPASQACDVTQGQPSSQTFIKRLVGLPGDRISIVNGHVIRNGVREHDPYAVACRGMSACNLTTTIRVPAGEYYMMGDNRPDSEDSRYWGPVPRKWIIGRAILTYWPPGRLGFL
ncbi:MAG TPA: signal peptidase I [Solirubrobacteraceae bacterium]|nr:signal peptidase I [Solirubrobacteraceae bacterium]